MCLCVFVPVCVSGDSQWGQRVSVAPCVAYKLIKDNPRRGKAHSPSADSCVSASGPCSGSEGKMEKTKIHLGSQGGLQSATSPKKWFTD